MKPQEEIEAVGWRVRRINDHGALLACTDSEAWITEIRAYHEGGSVQLWVRIRDRDYLAYLNPIEAMALAKGLERSAILCLKANAE